jgi:hypothetical protein
VAPELDIDTRALSPVNISHCRSPTLANLALQRQLDQYRQWAIALCCPRLATRHSHSDDSGNGHPATASVFPPTLVNFDQNLWVGGESGKYLGMVNTRQLSIIFAVYYPGDYPVMRFTHATDNKQYKALIRRLNQPEIPDNYG